MSTKMTRDDVLMRLERLDEDASLLFDDDSRFNMVIVGGSALILLETITRATRDIDVLDVSKEIVSLLEKYDINTRVTAYMNNFPFNYADRLIPVRLNGRRIDFYTASLEDVVIAKLCSARDTDMQDITDPKVIQEIDWDLLRHLATSEEELRASVLNEFNYQEFLCNYQDYVERWRPCAN